MAVIDDQRAKFHQDLLEKLITIDGQDVASIADRSSESSKTLSSAALQKIGELKVAHKMAGQKAGRLFEEICQSYIEKALFSVKGISNEFLEVQRGNSIDKFAQFAHLGSLSDIAHSNPELATAIGQDYLIKPDVLVVRRPKTDSEINEEQHVVEGLLPRFSPLRRKNNRLAILHATVSCKYTIRSDRAQNARSEALNLIRNRKGRTPHIVVITAEPLPSRIASLALGTGDIDCVYHAFLNELHEAAEEQRMDETAELLNVMTEGDRLRDISDLPLDLAI